MCESSVINESPVDPAYYEKMSMLLDALIEQRRKAVLSYTEYLKKIAQLAKDVSVPAGGPACYPTRIQTAALRALYNNLGHNEPLAVAVDMAVLGSLQDDWRNNSAKTKRVRFAIRHVLNTAVVQDSGLRAQQVGEPTPPLDLETETNRILDLVKHQSGY